jgi:heme-degrading monooxygenase HmoA
MFLRLVHVRYNHEFLSKIREIYDKEVIPRLEKVEGCLCVCAIASDQDPEEGISLTIWKTRENAEAYEKSGVYEQLLNKIRPYLADSTEWHVQLSKDYEVEFKPIEKEPSITTYVAASKMSNEIPNHDQSSRMFLRIVSVFLQKGKLKEFTKIYEKDILPALQNMEGCKFAFMTENSEREDAVLCVSLWDSKENAEAYEKNGLFDDLRKKTRRTFSEFYRWKMALENELGARVATSEDMKVDKYHVVVGKSFK